METWRSHILSCSSDRFDVFDRNDLVFHTIVEAYISQKCED